MMVWTDEHDCDCGGPENHTSSRMMSRPVLSILLIAPSLYSSDSRVHGQVGAGRRKQDVLRIVKALDVQVTVHIRHCSASGEPERTLSFS
jgi:hypothetical protein